MLILQLYALYTELVRCRCPRVAALVRFCRHGSAIGHSMIPRAEEQLGSCQLESSSIVAPACRLEGAGNQSTTYTNVEEDIASRELLSATSLLPKVGSA